MAVFFWYLVKSYLSSLGYCKRIHWKGTSKGSRFFFLFFFISVTLKWGGGKWSAIQEKKTFYNLKKKKVPTSIKLGKRGAKAVKEFFFTSSLMLVDACGPGHEGAGGQDGAGHLRSRRRDRGGDQVVLANA